jgi:mitochondrial cardiolipin hydrolase
MQGARVGWRTWLAAGLLLAGAAAGTRANTEAPVLAFDPDLRRLVLAEVAGARTSLEIEMFKLSDRGVEAALGAAARRGVAVRVLLCPSQEGNAVAAAVLRRRGVEVRWYPLAYPDQIMHLKMALCDRQRLLFGSVNWTHTGLTLNHEGLLVLADPDLAGRAAVQFDADWDKSSAVFPRLPKSRWRDKR